ncbi:uncharacterized protein LOC122501872 [Leptopilina heterotoma]|uniref:uncharacterized protein LOC122501872 n=1 Tax=Leptopilina heterotoma TaxID=63436 RepID=UPI001CA94F2E|nr:uncharacterized protein LOC122501872 [Leptopilina heterotoma]
MGLKLIWGIIRGFQARNTSRSTGIYNDPNNPAILKLQNELDRNPQTTYVGLPQGGVLSHLLYNVYTTSILNHIGPNTKTTIYVDDIFLYASCHTVQEGLAELQHSIELLSDWLESIGLIISIPKCNFCLFTKAQIDYSDIFLEVNGVLIPCQREIKYLEKTAKAINTLKALARVSRGASSESLLLVFKGLIRAYLKWGSVLFMEAAQYFLKILDTQQFKALRIFLGCMSSTPLYFLLVESGEIPLEMRRILLAKRFIARNFTWSENPLRPKLILLKTRIDRNNRPKQYIINSGIYKVYTQIERDLNTCFPSRRPLYFDSEWTSINLKINSNITLGYDLKGSQQPDINLNTFLTNNFPHAVHVYTDGSSNPQRKKAGAGFYISQLNIRYGVPVVESSSPLTTELYAIYISVKYIITENITQAVIITDSLDSINLINKRHYLAHSDSVIPHRIADLITQTQNDTRIDFIWIPAHSSSKGNNIADRIAKDASALPFIQKKIASLNDLFSKFKQYNNIQKAQLWPYKNTTITANRVLQKIQYKTKRPWFCGLELPRGCTTLITRLRINHICTAEHFEKMKWNLPMECNCGEAQKTLTHLLNDCPLLSPGRPEFFSYLNSLSGILTTPLANLDNFIFQPTKELAAAIHKFFNQQDSKVII